MGSEMTEQDWPKRIIVDPNVCHGKPCLLGTRIMVSILLDNLAAGVPEREILEAYPWVTPEDIRASLAYAAAMAREHTVPVTIPGAE
jgi:uncharacterized protein (DUF433 family)